MSSSQYAIFQLKEEGPCEDLRALPYSELLKKHRRAYIADYRQIYTGQTIGTDPNVILRKLSRHLPEDFMGHPIEIGDVIAVKHGGDQSAYYVDSVEGNMFLVILSHFFTTADNRTGKKEALSRGVEQHDTPATGSEDQPIKASPDSCIEHRRASIYGKVADNQVKIKQHHTSEKKEKSRVAGYDR